MTVNKAILCGLIAVMVSGGVQAADSQQNLSNEPVVAVGTSANAAQIALGEHQPQASDSGDFLEVILETCVRNHKAKGMTLSDCIEFYAP